MEWLTEATPVAPFTCNAQKGGHSQLVQSVSNATPGSRSRRLLRSLAGGVASSDCGLGVRPGPRSRPSGSGPCAGHRAPSTSLVLERTVQFRLVTLLSTLHGTSCFHRLCHHTFRGPCSLPLAGLSGRVRLLLCLVVSADLCHVCTACSLFLYP